MSDVTPLSPSVRPIVLEAAEVYYRHTCPWFIGLLIHGSAYKGGVIPGCSDIDLQLYLENKAFDSYGGLPIELAVAIQRDLSTIDTRPFQYIQTYAFPYTPQPTTKRKQWAGPIPGAYHLLRGRLPIPEATEAELLAGSHRTLQQIPNGLPMYLVISLSMVIEGCKGPLALCVPMSGRRSTASSHCMTGIHLPSGSCLKRRPLI